MRSSIGHVVLSLVTVALGTSSAFVAASCSSQDATRSGENAGTQRAAATLIGTIQPIPRPIPTLDPRPLPPRCLLLDCPSDGNFCTSDCTNGVCGFTPLTCNDGNVCTDDRCNEVLDRCDHVPNTAPCTDGNGCTLDDRCAAGVCAPGAQMPCDDNEACTTDTCDPAKLCQYTPVEDGTVCDDGTTCTARSACSAGKCSGISSGGCVDDNPCTREQCGTTCTHLPLTGQACGQDKCLSGQTCDRSGNCTGGEPVVCDDGNPCTDDSCDPAEGCVYTNNEAECDDDNACTSGDHCDAGACAAESVIACAAIDSCHHAGACDPVTGICSDPRKPDGEECERTGACEAGRCVGGTPDAGGAGGETSGGGDAGETGSGTAGETGSGTAGETGSGTAGETGSGDAGESGNTGGTAGRGPTGRGPVNTAGDDSDDGDRGEMFKRDPGGCAVARGAHSTPIDYTALLGGALGLALLAGRRRRAS